MTHGIGQVAGFIVNHISIGKSTRAESGACRGIILLKSHYSESRIVSELIKRLGLRESEYMFLASGLGTSLMFDYDGNTKRIWLVEDIDDPLIKTLEYGWAVIEMDAGESRKALKHNASLLLDSVKCPLAKHHDVLYYQPLKGRDSE